MQIPHISDNESDNTDNKQTAQLQSQPQPDTSHPSPDPSGIPGVPTPHHPGSNHDHLTGGFCGRINKGGDTCYSFWVGGALDVLGFAELMHLSANRKFLLEYTQHVVGGFGKLPGPRCLPGKPFLLPLLPS